MELNRNELREYMDNIDSIRSKPYEEQKQVILKKVEDVLNYLKDKYPYDSYSMDRQKNF